MAVAETVKGNKALCHDCKKELEISGKEIKNGVELVYEENGEKFSVLKCNDCYRKSPGLSNYRKCEVYSRVVGYLRPVQQWHLGKKQEFKDRKEFRQV